MQPVGQRKVNGTQVKHMPGHGPPMEGGRCPDSGSGLIMGGPIWSQPIHDVEFVKGRYWGRAMCLQDCMLQTTLEGANIGYWLAAICFKIYHAVLNMEDQISVVSSICSD